MTTGNVFDDLSEGLESKPEPSPLTGIFAAEFIVGSEPDVLLAATRGIARAIKPHFHPDSMPIKADQAIIERARSLALPYAEDEDPEVIKVRTQLDQGAAIVTQWDRIIERIEADPLAAKMQALRDIKEASGRLPRPGGLRRQPRERDRQPQESSTISLPGLEVDTLNAIPVRSVRERQETLLTPEALHTIDDAYVLSMADIERPVLFALRSGGGRIDAVDQYYRVMASPLRLLKPINEVIEAWQETAKKEKEDEEYPPKKSDLAVLTKDGGLKLSFSNVGEAARAGRSIPAGILSKLNAPPRNETSFFPPYRYQLVVLDDQGDYQFMPSIMGDAYGFETKTDDGSLRDWALNTYGVVPDALYIVNDATDDIDGRVLYAYKGEGEQFVFGEADQAGRQYGDGAAYQQLALIGFLDNLTAYEQVAEESDRLLLAAGETDTDSVNTRKSLVNLRENLDALLRTGLCPDFFPVVRLHQRSRKAQSNDFGLVFSINHRADDEPIDPNELDPYMPVQQQEVFAVRAPVAVGVIRPSGYRAERLRQITDTGRQADLLDKLGAVIRESLPKIVEDVLGRDKEA